MFKLLATYPGTIALALATLGFGFAGFTGVERGYITAFAAGVFVPVLFLMEMMCALPATTKE